MSNYVDHIPDREPDVQSRYRSPFEVMSGFLKSGRFITDLSEEFNPERTPLPDGYCYASASSVTVSEIANLWSMRRRELLRARSIHEEYGRTIIDVGVRNANQRLVGNGTLSYDKEGNGELMDFIVRPQDRGLGIGKAIIDERLRIATALGIESIQIEGLETTNTLTRYYLQKGFVWLEDDSLILRSTLTPLFKYNR